jgi:biopolymer transport protein ExbD
MPKIKVPKSAPSLDMTPMVDLAFLLVTFFMLTAKFRNMEPIEAEPPYSTSEIQLKENVLLVTIDKAGRAYYDISDKAVRQSLITGMMKRYQSLKLSPEEIDGFIKMGTFGQPLNQLAAYIRADADTKEAMDKQSKGIPLDSLDNQLGDWIIEGFYAFKRNAELLYPNKTDLEKFLKENGLRYAIKADADTDYENVEKVIDVFREREIYQFNMVTSLVGSEKTADVKLDAQ